CTRVSSPTGPTAAATVEARLMPVGFESAFYRELLQNAFEAPNHLEQIRLLRAPLRIYLRTEDAAEHAIDAATQDLTEEILRNTTAIWSGDTFDVLEVVRG